MAYKTNVKIAGTNRVERFKNLTELQQAVGSLWEDELADLRAGYWIEVQSPWGRISVKKC